MVIWFVWFYLVNLVVLPDFICIRGIVSFWSICLGINIFNPFPCVAFVGNIPLLKALRVNSRP